MKVLSALIIESLNVPKVYCKTSYLAGYKKALSDINDLQTDSQGEWIHITFRPMTDEEYEHYSSEIGDCPKEECCVYSCQMPEDCEEVLITTSWGKVCEDIYHQEIDCCYFEDHDDPDDVIAWMKKPQPYRESEEQTDVPRLPIQEINE